MVLDPYPAAHRRQTRQALRRAFSLLPPLVVVARWLQKASEASQGSPAQSIPKKGFVSAELSCSPATVSRLVLTLSPGSSSHSPLQTSEQARQWRAAPLQSQRSNSFVLGECRPTTAHCSSSHRPSLSLP